MNLHPFRGLERDILLFLTAPLDGLQIDAIMILQDAAHPQAGGILQGIEPNTLAVQISRFVNAAAVSFHHILMAKTAVRKYRNSVVVASPVPRHKITYQ